MRRKDREKDAEFALEVVKNCEYATLATLNADGTPYCIPVSPALLDGAVYFHCAGEGQKLDNLRANPAVCLSCVGESRTIPEKYAVRYTSAVAAGTCSVVADPAEARRALYAIAEKYAPAHLAAFEAEMQKYAGRTAVCKITIHTITGKAGG